MRSLRTYSSHALVSVRFTSLKLPLLDPQVARQVGIIAANLLDEALGVLAADERLDAKPRERTNEVSPALQRPWLSLRQVPCDTKGVCAVEARTVTDYPGHDELAVRLDRDGFADIREPEVGRRLPASTERSIDRAVRK